MENGKWIEIKWIQLKLWIKNILLIIILSKLEGHIG